MRTSDYIAKRKLLDLKLKELKEGLIVQFNNGIHTGEFGQVIGFGDSKARVKLNSKEIYTCSLLWLEVQ